ncbi:MAG: lipid-A-disaccharide synthase [Bacteroidales bacterium]
MKYFIIAGEKSGDLHGSNLVRGLLKTDPDAKICCWGGDMMKEAGADLKMHYRHTAFMGFVTIVMNIRAIKRNLELCKQQIGDFKPDVVILIDYPGFNLRIAEFAKGKGFRVFYYISPKLWAWKEGRVEKVKRYVDRMYIIFPFEKEFYNKHGIPAEYYGNPLVDEIEKRKRELPSPEAIRRELGIGTEPVITILAGSREQEVRHILPRLVKSIGNLKGFTFIIAAVDTISDEYYKKYSGSANIRLIHGKTYELLSISEAAIVKSGTSTLEAALLDIPQVVVYAGDWLSFIIARQLVKVRFISLVNLILEKEVVRELIQYLMTEENITNEIKAILPGGIKRSVVMDEYRKLHNILGGEGASDRVASEMVKTLSAR